ncbi:MAG: hypothetical protein K2L81_07690, partial [Muribaculaceae bacterium]|nr:hypothetical protein [Muribaculaceae bacterium]
MAIMSAATVMANDYQDKYLDKPIPSQWESTTHAVDSIPTPDVTAQWWTRFDDPTLTSLIE